MNELFTLENALNMNRRQLRENYQRYINPSLVEVMSLLNFDKLFVKAKGIHLWDTENKQYLDFLGGYGALNLGHNPPEILAAIRKVQERPNLLQAALNPLAAALAANLAQVTPGDLSRTFFCNSGTEAVEGALKLARAAHPHKKKILYCQNSFHGKSFGSLSVTGREKYQHPFRPLLPDCVMIPFGDLNALEQTLAKHEPAAFIIEPIQGEGGINLPPEGYFPEVRKLCDQYDTFLIIDEIQTGLGRTGTLFACEHDQIVPDVLCLAKSLGGGVMPVGAYIARPQLWDKVYQGRDKYALHTSTFGGNSLAMAAGLAALESIIKKDLPLNSQEKGQYLLEKLHQLKNKHNIIKEIRGRGLLIGIEFQQPAHGLVDKLSGGTINKLAGEYFASLVAAELMNKYQIITAYTLNNPNVIRLEPPLIIDYPSIDLAIKALDEILSRNFAGITLNSLFTILNTKITKR